MAKPTLPVTIVAGFLGVGKTTLLNHLLAAPDGRRLAVLVNDFGKINIDASLIEARDGDVVSLANGCICCSIGDDLGGALLDLNALSPRPDHVVIETSGIAFPGRVRDIVEMLPGFRCEAVIVLADGERMLDQVEDPQIGALIRDQIAAADLLALNKLDLAGRAGMQRNRDWLVSRFPKLAICDCANAELPSSLVLGWVGSNRLSLTTDNGPGFKSGLFRSSRPIDRARFTALIEDSPPCLLRAKGFIRFADRPTATEVFQLAGQRWRLSSAVGDRATETALVYITHANAPAVSKWKKRLEKTIYK